MDPDKWVVLRNIEPSFKKQLKSVFIFGNDGEEVLMITKEDRVFALGSNKEGCLGLPTNIVPDKKPLLVDGLSGLGIIKFSAGTYNGKEVGYTHVAALTNTGKIYTFGSNAYGKLAYPENVGHKSPYLIKHCEARFVQVVCGAAHTVTLDKNGQLYVWGENRYGQCGQGNVNETRLSPTSVKGDKEFTNSAIKMVTCGAFVSFALTSTGKVYFWGHVYIDKDDKEIISSPTLEPELEKHNITKISCGRNYILALCNVGKVFTWQHDRPFNKKIQMGNGKFVDILTSNNCNINAAKRDDGRIFMWGLCGGRTLESPLETSYKNMGEVFACEASPSVTPSLTALNSNKVFHSLKNAFDSESFSDLKIIVENKPIYVSKLILKMRSEHFLRLLSSNWKEGSSSEIELEGYSYKAYRALLYYLYTDEVVVEEDFAPELLILADMYMEESLKRFCTDMIKRCVNSVNVSKFYKFAKDHNITKLEESCVEYVSRNTRDVVETQGFRDLDPLLAKDLFVSTVTMKKQ